MTGTVAPSALVRYGQSGGRWVLLAAVLGSALAFIDATVVNVALPHIAASFRADTGALQWTVNGYTLSLASLILLGGSLGDRFGRRKILVTGVTWFATASLLCGLAPSMDVLIAARVLQGAGGALLTPATLATLQASFHPDDRAKAVGAWSGLVGIGGALGPFLGGWLVEAGNWRLVFLVNVPLAAVVAVVALRHVPESRDPDAQRRLDIAGVLTGATGLAGLTYGFTAWPARGVTSPAVLGALAVGLGGIAAFVVAERTSPHPMLPPEVFASRAFTAANLVTFAVYAALGGVLFLVVLNLQVVGRYSPLAAGAALLPVTVLMLLLSARTGALAQRTGPRLPMTLGPVICAGALVLFSRIGPNHSYVRDVLPAAVILGLGLSLTVAPLTATALGSVSERHAGVASGINNAVARAAGLLAIAVLPLAAGLGTGSLTNPADLAPTYRTAMLLCAGLLAAGAGIALAAIPARFSGPDTAGHTDARNPPVHSPPAGPGRQPS
ncbi:MAG TPA: MFS transporter [Trebonia sp.]